MSIAKNIGAYIKEKGFNLSEISRKTDVDYNALYTSLYDKNSERDLRCEELVPLTAFLDIDPRDFVDEKRG